LGPVIGSRNPAFRVTCSSSRLIGVTGLFAYESGRNQQLTLQHIREMEQEVELRSDAEQQLKILIESPLGSVLGAGLIFQLPDAIRAAPCRHAGGRGPRFRLTQRRAGAQRGLSGARETTSCWDLSPRQSRVQNLDALPLDAAYQQAKERLENQLRLWEDVDRIGVAKVVVLARGSSL
jgi:hypothetical protein